MSKLLTKTHFDFSIGEAVCVREVLDNFYMPFTRDQAHILSIKNMGYQFAKKGFSYLIENTKRVIEEETNLKYQYVLITAGATQAIQSSLLALKKDLLSEAKLGFKAPYYPHYPEIANICGYRWVNRTGNVDVFLADSPSNPEGKISFERGDFNISTVWDATYANRIYSKIMGAYPNHLCMIGSFGKLLGINGVRVGWLATNDEYFFDKISKMNYLLSLGVSLPSQRLVSSILEKVDMKDFTKEASMQLDCNREEMSKLEYLSMDKSQVPINGMFYWLRVDQKARALLKLAGVKWVDGPSCGGTEDHIRLNIAQSRVLTKLMVKTVRKLDGKK